MLYASVPAGRTPGPVPSAVPPTTDTLTPNVAPVA